MKTKSSGVMLRLAACVVVAISAVGIAACGSSGQALTFERTTEGRESVFSVPDSAEAGEAEVTLVNNGADPVDLQLFRAEGDHTAEEVVEGFNATQNGGPFPDWFHAAGGVGAVPVGKEVTVTQILEPGIYYAFDTEGFDTPPDPETITGVEVTGDASDDSLEADARVSASEYGFESEGLVAGSNELLFENEGVQPHHLIALKMIGDSTLADIDRFFTAFEGKSPVEAGPSTRTAVLEGGESQVVDFELEPGRYALVCFTTDRQGGIAHTTKGMFAELEVE